MYGDASTLSNRLQQGVEPDTQRVGDPCSRAWSKTARGFKHRANGFLYSGRLSRTATGLGSPFCSGALSGTATGLGTPCSSARRARP
eukprot:2807334-Prymnesium_polylepis.1